MMRPCLRGYAAILGACLILPAAATLAPQARLAPAAPISVSSTPLKQGPEVCLVEVFYRAMPGIANYCEGMRDWDNRHYRSAMELFKLAAGWGNKNAQYTLGLIFFSGHHVATNPALGIAWLKLADERHNDPQIELAARSAIKSATQAQQQHARQLLDELRKTYGDRVAGVRAWHHLQHWKLTTYAADTGCIKLHGAQAHAALAARIGIPVFTGHSSFVCVHMKERQHLVRASASPYFDGLFGTVSVGPLETVPAPAASSGH